MAQNRSFWLMKSEPDCFSIQHLAKCPRQTTCWSGVRNYQARNFMRDQMKLGDEVLFYHSGGELPAVAGTAVVVREAYPDRTAWDPRDEHFDPKASPDNPIWQMVDIQLKAVFSAPVPLEALRKIAALKDMELLRKGSRLSVQPVRPSEFEVIVELAERTNTARTSGKSAKKPREKSRSSRSSAASR
jgi:predicted RNA-binding protein with PUA-like domain